MLSKDSSYEQELWQKWNASKDDQMLNDIISHYMYLVDFHVDRIFSHVPKSVSKDDIKSFGLIGLYDAVHKFESERNLKFDTYASFRIRGAIMDGLRKEDWLPRTLRDKVKKIDQVSEQLEQELGRSPQSSEIAGRLDMTAEEVETAVRDALFSHVLSIEEKTQDDKTFNEGIGYSVPDKQTVNPEQQMIDKELREQLMSGIQKLNKNEQLVISLFYDEELTLTEIGKVLNLTTSRISQIHKKALFKLKDILSKIR